MINNNVQNCSKYRFAYLSNSTGLQSREITLFFAIFIKCSRRSYVKLYSRASDKTSKGALHMIKHLSMNVFTVKFPTRMYIRNRLSINYTSGHRDRERERGIDRERESRREDCLRVLIKDDCRRLQFDLRRILFQNPTQAKIKYFFFPILTIPS